MEKESAEQDAWASFEQSISLINYNNGYRTVQPARSKLTQSHDRVGGECCPNGACVWEKVSSESLYVCKACGDWHRCVNNNCLRAKRVPGRTWACPISGCVHTDVVHEGDEFSDGAAAAPFAEKITRTVACKSDPTIYGESKADAAHHVAFHQSRQVVSKLLSGETRIEVESDRVTKAKVAAQQVAMRALLKHSLTHSINVGYAEFERRAGGVVVDPKLPSKMIDALASKCAEAYCTAVLKLDSSISCPRANYSAIATLYALQDGVPGLYPPVPACQFLPSLKFLHLYGYKTTQYTMAKKVCNLAFSALRDKKALQ